MLRNLILAAMLACALPTVLPGCSTFQQVQQLPFDQRLKLAYETHALVTGEVTTALEQKQISAATARSYLELAEGSRKLLDESRALVGVDLSSAEAQLQLASDILKRAQAALIKAGEK